MSVIAIEPIPKLEQADINSCGLEKPLSKE
jgi:hypothetical protein